MEDKLKLNTQRPILFFILLSISLVSCSNLVENTRKSLLGDEKPRSAPKKEVKWVSKSQYDDLMQKYKDLNDKYERIKLQTVSESGLNDLPQTAPKAQGGSTETVDVFGKNGVVNKKQTTNEIAASSAPQKIKNTTSIGEDLDYYKKAVVLKENNKLDEALKIFQFLENSKSKQISVRSKRHIGDIYFEKQQHDLALQVYEDVIRNNAFSGATLKALAKAAQSANQLGLMDKKAQYESLLKDVFDIQG